MTLREWLITCRPHTLLCTCRSLLRFLLFRLLHCGHVFVGIAPLEYYIIGYAKSRRFSSPYTSWQLVSEMRKRFATFFYTILEHRYFPIHQPLLSTSLEPCLASYSSHLPFMNPLAPICSVLFVISSLSKPRCFRPLRPFFGHYLSIYSGLFSRRLACSSFDNILSFISLPFLLST